MVEVANKETPTELKPPYLLENRNAPSANWGIIADYKRIWLELGGEEEALDIIIKHTRVVTPELKSQQQREVVDKVVQLIDNKPKQEITLVATGGRSGRAIAEWFTQTQDLNVIRLKENTNIDWGSLALSAEQGSQYSYYAPDKLYDSDQEQTVCLIDDWGLSGEKLDARIGQIEGKINIQRVKNKLSPLQYWVLLGGLSERARKHILKATDGKGRINIQASYKIPSIGEELEQNELDIVNTSLRKIYDESWVEINVSKYLIIDWIRGAPDNFPPDFTPLGGLMDNNGKRHVLFNFRS